MARINFAKSYSAGFVRIKSVVCSTNARLLRRDFWEICEERYQTRSTILTSQLPISRGTKRLATSRWPTASWTVWFTMRTGSR